MFINTSSVDHTLALSHGDDLHRDAIAATRARRLIAAKRWQRRADRAALRAQQAQSAIR